MHVIRDMAPPTVPTIPAMSAVKPAEKLSVEVTWSEGRRAGRTEKVDLAPLINSLRIYKALRNNRALFETVRLLDDQGDIIAWSDGEIDMDSTAIERLAEDMMTANDFKAFIDHLDFTHNTAAAQLGYSRRQIENFLAGTKPIPRVCALACLALRHRYDEQLAYGHWSGLTTTVSAVWPAGTYLSVSEASVHPLTGAFSPMLLPSETALEFSSPLSHAAIKQITHHAP
jgi:hypothetical protein